LFSLAFYHCFPYNGFMDDIKDIKITLPGAYSLSSVSVSCVYRGVPVLALMEYGPRTKWRLKKFAPADRKAAKAWKTMHSFSPPDLSAISGELSTAIMEYLYDKGAVEQLKGILPGVEFNKDRGKEKYVSDGRPDKISLTCKQNLIDVDLRLSFYPARWRDFFPARMRFELGDKYWSRLVRAPEEAISAFKSETLKAQQIITDNAQTLSEQKAQLQRFRSLIAPSVIPWHGVCIDTKWTVSRTLYILEEQGSLGSFRNFKGEKLIAANLTRSLSAEQLRKVLLWKAAQRPEIPEGGITELKVISSTMDSYLLQGRTGTGKPLRVVFHADAVNCSNWRIGDTEDTLAWQKQFREEPVARLCLERDVCLAVQDFITANSILGKALREAFPDMRWSSSFSVPPGAFHGMQTKYPLAIRGRKPGGTRELTLVVLPGGADLKQAWGNVSACFSADRYLFPRHNFNSIPELVSMVPKLLQSLAAKTVDPAALKVQEDRLKVLRELLSPEITQDHILDRLLPYWEKRLSYRRPAEVVIAGQAQLWFSQESKGGFYLTGNGLVETRAFRELVSILAPGIKLSHVESLEKGI
jgi:hypothetical protein